MNIEVISCGAANAYLLHGDNGSILIDTGTEKDKDKVLECCKSSDLKLILLTHGHFDHCQNAAYLAEKMDCSVGISLEDAPLLERGEKRKVFGKGIWGNLYAWLSNRNIQRARINAVMPNVIVENETSLLKYGIDGKVINLPGHTKGSIGVLLASGEFFVGDAMQNIVSASGTWCFEDYKQSIESVALIQNSRSEKIFYGHGKPTIRYSEEEPR